MRIKEISTGIHEKDETILNMQSTLSERIQIEKDLRAQIISGN
jgi:hypothetical protein